MIAYNLTRDSLAACPPFDWRVWTKCEMCDYPLRSDGLACTNSGGAHPTARASLTLYASRTGTITNLRAMGAEGVRLLATPEQLSRYAGTPPLAYALDNGAWSAHVNGRPFDGAAYAAALDRLGPLADWIALPDIVCGGLASLDLSLSWVARVEQCRRPMLLVVQDGMTPDVVDAAIGLGAGVGLFVGGSTRWKLDTLLEWGALARRRGCILHVGRVNTERRIGLCAAVGATSCDGTSMTRFSSNTARLARAARRGGGLPLWGAP